ncbi:MAG: YbaK/EbsC family protein [Myxococcota bacterium]
MARNRIPSTPALRTLRELGIPFEARPYAYVERGGARAAAEALGLDLHAVIKTLVFEGPDKRPFLVLMHGDREVSANRAARALGVKQVRPCDPAVAERHTGYRVGGTSPFGTRKPVPVLVHDSILELPRVAVNGGSRGLLVELDPTCFVAELGGIPADVAQ